MQKRFELLEVRVIEGSSYRDFTVFSNQALYWMNEAGDDFFLLFYCYGNYCFQSFQF